MLVQHSIIIIPLRASHAPVRTRGSEMIVHSEKREVNSTPDGNDYRSHPAYVQTITSYDNGR
jgi:hypothetical protein